MSRLIHTLLLQLWDLSDDQLHDIVGLWSPSVPAPSGDTAQMTGTTVGRSAVMTKRKKGVGATVASKTPVLDGIHAAHGVPKTRAGGGEEEAISSASASAPAHSMSIAPDQVEAAIIESEFSVRHAAHGDPASESVLLDTFVSTFCTALRRMSSGGRTLGGGACHLVRETAGNKSDPPQSSTEIPQGTNDAPSSLGPGNIGHVDKTAAAIERNDKWCDQVGRKRSLSSDQIPIARRATVDQARGEQGEDVLRKAKRKRVLVKSVAAERRSANASLLRKIFLSYASKFSDSASVRGSQIPQAERSGPRQHDLDSYVSHALDQAPRECCR